MLLETKNINENDIIIYSRNSTDENYNYRIIFVNDPGKHNRVISYEQVKKLVSEHFPKNLIAYRIVSNFPDVTINNATRGFTILLDNEQELIFTDPVFAVKTIEDYLGQNPSVEFRFRVQKVGYTTLNAINDKTNFREEFCFNMDVDEVVNQNDEKVAQTLLKKRSGSRKKKKFKDGEEKNRVFIPEKNFSEKYLPLSNTDMKPKKILKPGKIASRDERKTEGVIKYSSSKLNLGKLENLREENKQLELSFAQERRIVVKDFQAQTTRNDQQSLRNIEVNERDKETGKDPGELRSNYSDDIIPGKESFSKISGYSPIVIRKVGMDEQVETGKESEKENEQKEILFTGFITSLQNESHSKSKKHRKKKETDLLYLFKRLKEKENDSKQL